MSDNQRSLFRYDRLMTSLIAFMVVATGSFVGYFLFYFTLLRDWVGVLLMFLPGLFPVFLFRALLYRASIAVDERSISTVAFAIKTKTIEWREIRKIKKLRVYNGYSYVDVFEVEDRRHNAFCKLFVNICGPIGFTQDIQNLDSLISILNFHSLQHQIPLTVWNAENRGRDATSEKTVAEL